MASSKTSGDGGIDLLTLAITAAASAGAAYVCSKIWAPGTLASAAFMPVLVALLKEGLARPAQVVTRAVPVRGVVRSAPRPDEPFDPLAPPDPHAPPDERVAQHGEIPGASRSRRGRAWRAAILTGLLGFLVGAVIITVPELVAGEAASGEGRKTTLFGGNAKRSEREPTTTTTSPSETVPVAPEETVAVPPAETVTAPPAEEPPPEEPTEQPPATTAPAPPAAPVPAQPPPP